MNSSEDINIHTYTCRFSIIYYLKNNITYGSRTLRPRTISPMTLRPKRTFTPNGYTYNDLSSLCVMSAFSVISLGVMSGHHHILITKNIFKQCLSPLFNILLNSNSWTNSFTEQFQLKSVLMCLLSRYSTGLLQAAWLDAGLVSPSFASFINSVTFNLTSIPAPFVQRIFDKLGLKSNAIILIAFPFLLGGTIMSSYSTHPYALLAGW